MIPAMIIKLWPFPIPFWLIWSPIHNSKDVPAVNTVAIYIYCIGSPLFPIKAKAKAYPSIKAKAIPKYLVIWFIFWRPVCPCFLNSVKYGMMSICNNCIIIDAVMYGITPNANIEKFLSAPPPIVLINSKNPKFFVKSSVPGTLIEIPNINIVNAIKVKYILWRKSLFPEVNSSFIALNILDHLSFTSCLFNLF